MALWNARLWENYFVVRFPESKFLYMGHLTMSTAPLSLKKQFYIVPCVVATNSHISISLLPTSSGRRLRTAFEQSYASFSFKGKTCQLGWKMFIGGTNMAIRPWPLGSQQ
jgi:hypothetical protein